MDHGTNYRSRVLGVNFDDQNSWRSCRLGQIYIRLRVSTFFTYLASCMYKWVMYGLWGSQKHQSGSAKEKQAFPRCSASKMDISLRYFSDHQNTTTI
jgi:hypothetical protein